MSEGQVVSAKRINILYDDVGQHYHEVLKLTVPWRYDTCVKHVTKGVGETLRTCVTKCAAIYSYDPVRLPRRQNHLLRM